MGLNSLLKALSAFYKSKGAAHKAALIDEWAWGTTDADVVPGTGPPVPTIPPDSKPKPDDGGQPPVPTIPPDSTPVA